MVLRFNRATVCFVTCGSSHCNHKGCKIKVRYALYFLRSRSCMSKHAFTMAFTYLEDSFTSWACVRGYVYPLSVRRKRTVTTREMAFLRR